MLPALPIAACLSQCIHTGATGTGQYGILSKKFWSHSASSTALSNAINSDSIVEQAKQVCLDDFQETTPPPIVNTYPLVDFTSFDPGKLDESLVDSFNVPTYFPSPKDMIKAVEKNNYFSIERIELTYPKSKLVEKADAKTLMINLRAVLEVLFVNHFGSEIAEEAFTRTILKSDEISTWMKTNYQKASAFPNPSHVIISPDIDNSFPNPKVEHYEEKEKEWRTEHEIKLLAMNDDIMRIKESHGAGNKDGLGYDDLGVHLGVHLPEGYKIPKFEVFGGTGNPMAYIRRFAFNIEIVLDRYLLDRIKQKNDESFRDYAFRWRKEAAKVQPPMSKEEMVSVFSCTQEGEFYTRMVSTVRATFTDLVKIRESLEEGIRIGKIVKTPTSSRTSLFPKKKREYVEQVPPPANQNQYNPSRINLEKKPPKKFTSLAESRTQLFGRLMKAGYLQPIPPKPTNINSLFFHADQNCAYHSGAAGHNTEDCVNLKHKIQDLIDQKDITLQSPTPNVNSNPLLNHGVPTVNMIEIEGEWTSSKAITKVNSEGLKRIEEVEKIEKVVAALSKDLEGIIEPVMVPKKAFKQGIEYQLRKEDEIEDNSNESLFRPLPLLYQSFPVHEMSNDDGLRDGIGDLFEGCNALPDDFPKSSGMKEIASGEALQKWTSTPLITRHPSC
ncbi:hypothetical protein FXO38_18599 [Capsicum annuum]|nr:hypothetical protein FXO38_18599 [Capsicum annuum]